MLLLLLLLSLVRLFHLLALHCSSVKLLLLVRDPVARAYSHYNMTYVRVAIIARGSHSTTAAAVRSGSCCWRWVTVSVRLLLARMYACWLGRRNVWRVVVDRRRDPVGEPLVKYIRGTYVMGDATFREVVEKDLADLQRHGCADFLPGSASSPSAVGGDDASTAAGGGETGGGDSGGASHAHARAHVHAATTTAAAAGAAGGAVGAGAGGQPQPPWQYFARLPNGHGAHCFVGRGLYLLQIRQWLRAGYRREQLLVVCTERLQEHPQRELARVFAFLGLPPCDAVDTTPVNTASQRGRSYEPMPEDVRRRLREFYAPHNRALYEFTGQDYGWP